MRNLRIVVGYRTAHRSGDAEILGSGASPEALQEAIDHAPSEFVRFEFGVFAFQRRGRRRNSNHANETGAPQAADTVPGVVESSPAESPAVEEQEDAASPVPSGGAADELSTVDEFTPTPPRKGKK